MQNGRLGVAGSKDLQSRTLLHAGGGEGGILLAQLDACGGPGQSHRGGLMGGGAGLRRVGHTGPAGVGHLRAGAVQHIVEQAAALRVQLQVFKRGNAHAPLLVALVGLGGLDHGDGLRGGEVSEQANLAGVLMELAVLIAVGARGILHGHVVDDHGVGGAFVVLDCHIALIGGGGVVDAGLLIELELINPNGMPGGVIALCNI